MSYIVSGNTLVHIHAPAPTDTKIKILRCRKCKRRRKHRVHFYEWYGPLTKCLTCGKQVSYG